MKMVRRSLWCPYKEMACRLLLTHLTQLTIILTPRPPLQQLERGSAVAVKSALYSGERFEVGKNVELRNVSY